MHVKRSFLARKFPRETIPGAIFAVIVNSVAFLQGKALGYPETRCITAKEGDNLIDLGRLKESICKVGRRAGMVISQLSAVW